MDNLIESPTEHFREQYERSIYQIELCKRTIEQARLDQLDDDSPELAQIIEDIWDEMYQCVEQKLDAYSFLIGHTRYAPWELEEMETDILMEFDEPTTEV